MLSIGIEYLNGWAMATHPSDREAPEWPPHPDRLFMALAAAHFEADGDSAERAVLEWLATLGEPALLVAQASNRTTVTTFVPVNDSADPVKKNKSLMPSGSMPIGRDRQARTFPVTIPRDPRVFLCWEDVQPTATQRRSIDELCRKVTSVGHSASLVQMWVAEDLPVSAKGKSTDAGTPEWLDLVPAQSGSARFQLRVFGPGRLADLEARFNRAAIEDFARIQREIGEAKGKRQKELKAELAERYRNIPPQSLRPTPSLWHGYTPRPTTTAKPAAHGSHFSPDLIIVRQKSDRGGRRWGLESTLQLTGALRNAAMKHSAIQPPPEWLSGHGRDGQRSTRNQGHLAFVPLAHVGHEHADGHLLGMAIVVPHDVPQSELGECLNPLLFDSRGWPKDIRLFLGRLGEWALEAQERPDPRFALRAETWTAVGSPAERWASVTPIGLDRHAKGRDSWTDVEDCIAESCVRIGLPRPVDVIAAPVSMFVGAPSAGQMPRIERKSAPGQIRQIHAVITFPQPVIGPVLVGAGRYRGYGLCRPLRTGIEDAS